MSFISEILKINELINERYREETKLPKWITKLVIDHCKKKLIKIINKIRADYIPADAIYEFAQIIGDKYPLGNYRGIKSSTVEIFQTGYIIEIPVNIDDKIDASVYIHISQITESEYNIKLKIHTWTNTGSSNNTYDTSFNKYQALSIEACNELVKSKIYTNYKATIFENTLDILYKAITGFLMDEVNIMKGYDQNVRERE